MDARNDSSRADETPAEVGAAARPASAVVQPTERSFPLIALMQLATFLAATAACIDGRKLLESFDLADDNPLAAAALILLSAGLVGLLGLLIGLGQLRMRRSALVGGAIGATFGLAILAAYVAPAPIQRTISAAAVLMITTLALRVRSA